MSMDLKKFHHDGKSFFSSVRIESLIPYMLSSIIEETKAEHCRIALYENGTELFNMGRVHNMDVDDDPEGKISRDIVNKVIDDKKTFVSKNILKDEHFAALLRQDKDRTFIKQHVLSVACAPLWHKNDIFGVLYLDDTKHSAVFDESTGKLLEWIASLVSESLYNSLQNSLAQRKETEKLHRELAQMRDEINRLRGYGDIVGESPAINKIYEDIVQVKDLPVSVLVLGETGTGKELVARTLHSRSNRQDKPFLAINCMESNENLVESELFGHTKGAFTYAIKDKKGVIELADTGTLFIDEIGNLSLDVQNKLLRFLDDKKFYRMGEERRKERSSDVRLIFATNADISTLIKAGKFRDDLYRRIKNGVTFDLPPLRERGKDVLLIAEKLLARYSREYGRKVERFSKAAEELLLQYAYPGNVRDLQRFIANAVIWAKSEAIQPEDFPDELRNNQPIIFTSSESTASSQEKYNSEIYKDFLSRDYEAFTFVSGINRQNPGENGAGMVHTELLVSIPKATDLPFNEAKNAMLDAFERNYLLENYNKCNRNVSKTAEKIGLDRGHLNQKLKRLGIK